MARPVILVTGASRGLGRGIALPLAREKSGFKAGLRQREKSGLERG